MSAVSVPAPSSGPRATIVVAEDDPETRTLLCHVLTREHFHVIAVENGQLACEAVRNLRPDVVLLDWRMPVMDGHAALEALKADKDTRGIPIVMLTSRSQVDERIIALESGVQDFLSKPFDPRELVACIEQQLRWQQGLALDARAAFLEERNALLAASERRYRLLAEAMPHMVWMADPAGRLTYVNRSWTEYTAKPIVAIGPQGWIAEVHPDDRPLSLAGWQHSLETGEPYEIQCRLWRASDGMYRWHLGRATPVSDDAGTIVEWVGSCADIHDYKIAGETRAILDTIGSIVTIRTSAGFVDYAGPYWSAFTGALPSDALGFGWRDVIHPDDLADVERVYAQAASEGRGGLNVELRIRGADGEYRWFLSRSSMLPQTPGAPSRWLETATDVDDLKRAQAALKSSEARHRFLTDAMPQMVWVLDDAGRFTYVNHRWTEYTGLTLEATQGVDKSAIVAGEDLAAIVALREAPNPVEFTCDARIRRTDGAFRWHTVRAMPFSDGVGSGHHWIGTAVDVDDRKVAAAQLASTAAELEYLANHDALTELPNRKLLTERLTQAIALAQRGKNGVIVLYLDLDRFKIINDTLGHAAGDRVLTVTAKRIASALRAGDTASRVGGDEFVLVCTTADAMEDAARLAARLLAAVGAPIDIDGEDVSVGASIGIALYPADGDNGAELIEKADSAMYAAKQGGRNAFRLFCAEAHTSIVAALDLESEIRAALAANELVVHYQPVYDLQSLRMIGAEALLRWQHPGRGLLSPPAFLPFAEERRLMGPIGETVLDNVWVWLAAADGRLDPDFNVAVNLSARQFADPALFATISDALARHRIAPRRLSFEIPENVITQDFDQAVSRVAALRELGVRVAIDDFGSALGALGSIRRLAVDTLKIDAAFVRNIATDPADLAIATTLVSLGHNFGLLTVAKCVETDAQLEALRTTRCDAVMGYVGARPVEGRALLHMLEVARTR